MKLPIDEVPPTFAELKDKGITWRTAYYNLCSQPQMNNFIADMEKHVNNPLKVQIYEFDYQPLVDGTPCIMVRYREDDKLDWLDKKIELWGKLYTTAEFADLDKILNSYDQTSVFLLGEKRLTMKTGDFFILLIWATLDKPMRRTEGLSGLRQRLTFHFSK